MDMIQKICFYIVIFFTNVIQGITGFAGTILAMPPSLLLVGYPVAKPVLNLLGMLAGIIVFAGGHQKCRWGEVRKIVLLMIPGLFAGFACKAFLAGKEQYLGILLAIFVLALSVQGMWKMYRSRSVGGDSQEEKPETDSQNTAGKAADLLLLVAAGAVHGIFVSGGPLLIGYLTRRVKEKESFRVTISVVWILLNGMILIDDIVSGYWNVELVWTQIAALPFFLAGMTLGGRLCKKMSQRTFMILTYILLFAAGITLLLK